MQSLLPDTKIRVEHEARATGRPFTLILLSLPNLSCSCIHLFSVASTPGGSDSAAWLLPHLLPTFFTNSLTAAPSSSWSLHPLISPSEAEASGTSLRVMMLTTHTLVLAG